MKKSKNIFYRTVNSVILCKFEEKDLLSPTVPDSLNILADDVFILSNVFPLKMDTQHGYPIRSTWVN